MADTVDAALTTAERDRLAVVPRVDPLAQDAFVRGCHHASKWTDDHCAAAIRLFEEAIAHDPGYAPAHAALAHVLFLLAYWGYAPLRETLTRAKKAAAAAVAHDEGLSRAHTALAWVHWALDWDFEASGRERRRALELGPSDAEAHVQAALLGVVEDRERAFAHGEYALRLDPLSEWTHVQLGWCYYFGGEPARALEHSRTTLERFPSSLMAGYTLGVSYVALGRAREGVAALENATRLAREPVGLAYLGCAYARVGRLEEARALLHELLARKEQRFVSLRPFMLLYTALGDTDRALDTIEHAYEERDPAVFSLPVVPLYARLRGEPRFEAVLAKLAAHRAGDRPPALARSPGRP